MKSKISLPTKVFSVLLCVSLLSSCGSIVKLPMHPDFYDVNSKKLPYTVLVYYSSDFDKSTYETSQLGTTWVYPLASTTKELIHNSLLSYFSAVGISHEGNEESIEYDVVIYPRIDEFEAKIPSTVFSPTKTRIRLSYDYVISNSTERKSIHKTATEEVSAPIGESAFEDMSHKEKTLGPGVGAVFSEIPKYEHRAARDGVVAITQAVYGLSAELYNQLSHNKSIQPTASRPAD